MLSRNHAVLWHEDGCFLLKDTKSSNGTFVNNDRLSKSAEESSPRQIYSGDILQFGVEISENANKGIVFINSNFYIKLHKSIHRYQIQVDHVPCS